MKKRILILDDDPSIQEDFRRILNPNQIDTARLDELKASLFGEDEKPAEQAISFADDIQFASQGEEGIQLIEQAIEAGEPFQVVFTDVRMPPGMDGIEVAKKILKLSVVPEIVICTAYADYSFEDIYRELGVSDRVVLLKKPFDSVEIKQLCLSLMQKSSLRDDLLNYLKNLETTKNQIKQELEHQQLMHIHRARMASIGEMASGVAHEINNPLAIVIGRTDLLLRDIIQTKLENSGFQESLECIKDTSLRISEIVKSLMIFCKEVPEGETDIIDVTQVIEETMMLCFERCSNAGVNLSVEAGNHSKINANRRHISQIIINLINNSLYAVTDQEEKWIQVGTVETKDTVEIFVTDSGVGIDKEIVEQVMQPFFTTKEIGNVGLGLSISKGLAELHSGKLFIDVQSKNTRLVAEFPKA